MRPSKILITGNAGAGKSSFAHELGNLLSLPVIGLDEIVWQAGWKKTPISKQDAVFAALVKQPTWIIDGVSPLIETHAELIVFLDVPPAQCT